MASFPVLAFAGAGASLFSIGAQLYGMSQSDGPRQEDVEGALDWQAKENARDRAVIDRTYDPSTYVDARRFFRVGLPPWRSYSEADKEGMRAAGLFGVSWPLGVELAEKGWQNELRRRDALQGAGQSKRGLIAQQGAAAKAAEAATIESKAAQRRGLIENAWQAVMEKMEFAGESAVPVEQGTNAMPWIVLAGVGLLLFILLNE